MPRLTVYYNPTKAVPKVDPHFAEPIKDTIKMEPSIGFFSLAAWLQQEDSAAYLPD